MKINFCRKYYQTPTSMELMQCWRRFNKLPKYINAAYDGFTGEKNSFFPTLPNFDYLQDITHKVTNFENGILQELKDLRKKPFGYVKALWRMAKKFGTGECWDTKYLPNFPGRDALGKKQYALYNNEIVSGNDLSNTVYAHVCTYMNIPPTMAKLIAKLDACGALEIFSKGKLPDKKLLSFRDTKSDQQIIEKACKSFNLEKYELH